MAVASDLMVSVWSAPYTLQQHMPVAEQTDQQSVKHMIPPDDMMVSSFNSIGKLTGRN